MTGYNPSAHDRWLDAPESPRSWLCDCHAERHDFGDLTGIDRGWYTFYYCPVGLAEYNAIKENENEG